MPKMMSGVGFVSTHSRLKAAGRKLGFAAHTVFVSTHSRLKAAGLRDKIALIDGNGFNTQPPEGGWLLLRPLLHPRWPCFNTQPPEGGWLWNTLRERQSTKSFNTQPPEGGWYKAKPTPTLRT